MNGDSAPSESKSAKPPVDKTWTNLLIHFEAAHQALRLVRGKTMKDTSFHQANHMAAQVLAEIKDVQANVLQALDQNRDFEEQRRQYHEDQQLQCMMSHSTCHVQQLQHTTVTAHLLSRLASPPPSAQNVTM